MQAGANLWVGIALFAIPVAYFAYIIASHREKKKFAIAKGLKLLRSLRGETKEMSNIPASIRVELLFYSLENGWANLDDIGTSSKELADLVSQDELRRSKKPWP